MIVGAIWKKKSKKGEPYLSIALEDPEKKGRKFNLVGFKNKSKETGVDYKGNTLTPEQLEKQPDYNIIFNDEEEQKGYSRPAQAPKPADDDGFEI